MIVELKNCINCLWTSSIYLGKGKYFCFKCVKIYEHPAYRIGLLLAQAANASKKMAAAFNSMAVGISKAFKNINNQLKGGD